VKGSSPTMRDTDPFEREKQYKKKRKGSGDSKPERRERGKKKPITPNAKGPRKSRHRRSASLRRSTCHERRQRLPGVEEKGGSSGLIRKEQTG